MVTVKVSRDFKHEERRALVQKIHTGVWPQAKEGGLVNPFSKKETAGT